MIFGIIIGIAIGFVLRPLIDTLVSLTVKMIRDRFGGY